MLRLRKSNGETLDIPDGLFVEICSVDGQVAKVIYKDGNGHIHEIEASDPEATQYTKLFPQVEFATVISL